MSTASVIKRAAVGERSSATPEFDISSSTDEILIFDTETTTDFSQRLRVGACMFKNRVSNTYRGFALFVADDLPDDDLQTVRKYAADFVGHLPKLISDQVAIRTRELIEHNSHLPPKSRKTQEALQATIDRASVSIRQAFEGMRKWCSETGRLPVWTRAKFAMVLTDAMRGRLSWGNNTPDGPCAIVALNALFDFGAIAAPHPSQSREAGNSPVMAWGYHRKHTGEKGFGFHLCECAERKIFDPQKVRFGNQDGMIQRAECPAHPSILSRNLGGRKNQYGISGGNHSGAVIDLSVLGRALLGPGDASLRGLGERLGATVLKRREETGHGESLTADYLDYLMVDIIATVELCELQIKRYEEHGLQAPITSIFSEASIGKAYLADFGIPGGFRQRQFRATSEGPPINVGELFRIAQQAYQGARSEVMERLTVKTIIHCDFKSQYPSVNALMGLQSLLTGHVYDVWRGNTAINRARDILGCASIEWLQQPANWQQLRILVKISVAGCFLPTKYIDPQYPDRKIYGMTKLSNSSRLVEWYPLSDVIASKMLTGGHIPEILDAIEITTVHHVETEHRNVFGLRIDLSTSDLFIQIIEHRTRVKTEQKRHPAGSDEYNQLDNAQNNLKLIANSTAYGILAETTMMGEAGETEGKYYAPFIACHITAGSRLLLAIAQTLAHDLGMRDFGTPILHAMCDTDSMAFVLPDGADYAVFDKVIAEICDYFSKLSPYEIDKSLFARELPAAGDDATGTRAYFFGVSCKRYVMFNRLDGDTIKLRKVSSHGLGHVRFDRGNASDDIKGDVSTDELQNEDDLRALPNSDRLDKWPLHQGYMWIRAIERSLGLRTAGKNEARHAGFPSEPWNGGVMRRPVGITTPSLMAEYAALGVRPGSFFMTMPAREGSDLRICMPRAASTAEIMAGNFIDKKGSSLPRSQIERLATSIHEGLRDYFVNPERKAKGRGHGVNQAPGRLAPHERTMHEISTRNRKGQRVEDHEDLFG